MGDKENKTDNQLSADFAELIKTVYEQGVSGKMTSPAAMVEEIKTRIKMIYK